MVAGSVGIRSFGAGSTISGGDPWDYPLRLTDAPFFADRDTAQLQAMTRELREASTPSITTDLAGSAHQALLAATRGLYRPPK